MSEHADIQQKEKCAISFNSIDLIVYSIFYFVYFIGHRFFDVIHFFFGCGKNFLYVIGENRLYLRVINFFRDIQ